MASFERGERLSWAQYRQNLKKEAIRMKFKLKGKVISFGEQGTRIKTYNDDGTKRFYHIDNCHKKSRRNHNHSVA